MPNFAPSFYLSSSWAVLFHFFRSIYVLCFLSSVDCNYFICRDFNIHVDVPCTDSYKLESLLESCNLTQSVNNTTRLLGHILDLILSPSDQDMCVHVDICEFISDHAVIKCAIEFPSSLANCQTRISYRRYHRINMFNFRSDAKDMPFVKCPANSVSQLYDQYVHDLSCILDRHAPLVSSLKTKQRADWLSESYRLAKSLRRQFELAWRKDKSQYNRSRLRHQIASVIILPTGTRLSITGNLSPTTAMIPRNYGGSYTKSYIDPTALLCPLVNRQSHWLIVLLHFAQIKS